MFALPNVLHFFAHEFPRLSGRGEPFTFIFARPFDSFFFWHNTKVSLWHPLLDVKLISLKVRAIDSESFRELSSIALDTASTQSAENRCARAC